MGIQRALRLAALAWLVLHMQPMLWAKRSNIVYRHCFMLALQLSKRANHSKATQCLCWHGFALAAGLAPKRGSFLLHEGTLQLRFISHRDPQLAKAWRLQLVSQIL